MTTPAAIDPMVKRPQLQAAPADETTNTAGTRGSYGCACMDRDSVQCAALRYGMDHWGEACECLCHQWDDDDEY